MYPNPNQQPPPWWQFRNRRLYYQQRFNMLPRRKKFIVGCGSLFGVFLLCSICAAMTTQGSHPQTSDVQASSTAATTPTPHPQYYQTAVAETKAAQARITPTPRPQPTATPVPIVAPTSQPESTLSVVFTGEDAADHASSSITVQTSPRAALTITVTYCTGKEATSESLRGTVYANDNGAYTWTWTPDTTCYGEAVAKVTANLNGQTASDSVSFAIM